MSMLEDIKAALDVGRPVITNSSCTHSIAYEVESQELTIVFVERGTYKYFGVPADDYLGLKEANSQGTYFNLYIRDRYPYERID